MDVLGPLQFLTDLAGKAVTWKADRPRLGVRIISFRPDTATGRWIFRASVLNYGRIAACGCEGFWSLFDSELRELCSGSGVFWVPAQDDDYDFENRSCRAATIE